MREIRTVAETRTLAAEAESRARAGEKLASISHTMKIPTSTLSDWARIGGWRRVDLKQEQHDEVAQLVAALSTSRPADNAVLETKSTEPPLALPPPRTEDPDGVVRVLAEHRAMALAEILMDRGQLDAADKAVRLATRIARFRSRLDHAVR